MKIAPQFHRVQHHPSLTAISLQRWLPLPVLLHSAVPARRGTAHFRPRPGARRAKAARVSSERSRGGGQVREPSGEAGGGDLYSEDVRVKSIYVKGEARLGGADVGHLEKLMLPSRKREGR